MKIEDVSWQEFKRIVPGIRSSKFIEIWSAVYGLQPGQVKAVSDLLVSPLNIYSALSWRRKRHPELVPAGVHVFVREGCLYIWREPAPKVDEP